jgi:hypothetical protein
MEFAFQDLSNIRFINSPATSDMLDVAGETAPLGDLSTACNFCNIRDCKLQCSTCKMVKYCSRQCQKNDWKIHKQLCLPQKLNKLLNVLSLAPETKDLPMLFLRTACNSCKKKNVKFYDCQRCKSVAYCCAECQAADWAEHKKACVHKAQKYLRDVASPKDFAGIVSDDITTVPLDMRDRIRYLTKEAEAEGKAHFARLEKAQTDSPRNDL